MTALRFTVTNAALLVLQIVLAAAILGCLQRPALAEAPSAKSTGGASSVSESAGTQQNKGIWNSVDLLEWVSEIGGPEHKYGHLASLKSFERLQRAIEEVKQMVLHDAQNDQEAIEGLRMILKHLAVSTHDTINNDFRNPLVAKLDPRNRDIGAYNPDAEYDQAYIDGRYEYKLTGNIGSVPYLSITVNARTKTKLSQAVGYLNDAEIRKHADADGTFTLWLTKQKPAEPGAWIHLPDEANGVIIRQYVGDRKRDTLASFSMEAIGDPLPNIEPIQDAEIAKRFEMLVGYLAVSSTWHRTLLPEMREQPNAFVSSSGSAIGESAANAENYYQMAYFEIADGESLIVDLEAPKAVFWNLTSATIWHESQRYLTDPVSLTSSEVTLSEDGRVRFVVSREDPGQPNWIKTFGHDRGFLIFRMVGVKTHPLPTVTRVPAL